MAEVSANMIKNLIMFEIECVYVNVKKIVNVK